MSFSLFAEVGFVQLFQSALSSAVRLNLQGGRVIHCNKSINRKDQSFVITHHSVCALSDNILMDTAYF